MLGLICSTQEIRVSSYGHSPIKYLARASRLKSLMGCLYESQTGQVLPLRDRFSLALKLSIPDIRERSLSTYITSDGSLESFAPVTKLHRQYANPSAVKISKLQGKYMKEKAQSEEMAHWGQREILSGFRKLYDYQAEMKTKPAQMSVDLMDEVLEVLTILDGSPR